MITKDGIEFKNPKIEEMIQSSMETSKLSQEEYIKKIKQMSRQEVGEDILGGFWSSLLGDAMMNSIDYEKWFDFTYDTLKNLPLAIAALFRLQSTSYSFENNRGIIGITMASVLYGLAMNEHNCALRVTHLPKDVEIGSIFSWGGDLSLKLGIKREVDFRKAGIESVTISPLEVDGGLVIDVTPLIKAYKSAIGVDLSEKGLANIIIGG